VGGQPWPLTTLLAALEPNLKSQTHRQPKLWVILRYVTPDTEEDLEGSDGKVFHLACTARRSLPKDRTLAESPWEVIPALQPPCSLPWTFRLIFPTHPSQNQG
jgi:hypothetical protein